MGWTEKIRTLSLELLRAGRCERFDEVVDAVMASAECRPHPAFDLSAAPSYNGTASASNGTGHAKGAKNGGTAKNGNTNANANGTGLSADAEAYLENVDVRIPSVVVEHGVRMVKDVLKDVVSWEDGSSLDEGAEQGAGGAGGGAGQATSGSKGGGGGSAASSTSGNHTSGKKLDKDKDKDNNVDSSTSKKNGDASPVKKTAKKSSNPGKSGK